MPLITKGQIISGVIDEKSSILEKENLSKISFDIKEIDFLIRKFSELNFSAKDVILAYNIILKLQKLQEKVMQSSVEIG